MADLRPTSNVPPEASGKAAGGKRARPARPARDVGGNGLWDRPQLLNLISDVLLVFGAAGLGYAAVAPEDTWEEVQQLCLPSPLKLMRQALRVGENPYEHVLAALEVFVKHVTAGALIHA